MQYMTTTQQQDRVGLPGCLPTNRTSRRSSGDGNIRKRRVLRVRD